MNTTLAVNLTLLPFAAFGIAVGMGHVTAGAVVGAVLAGALVGWRRRAAAPVPQMEAAMALTLAAITAWCLLAGPPSGLAASAAGFAGLGLGAAWSVARGRPWTADYAQQEYAGTEHDPLFLRINRSLSALWAVLFGWLALANALHLPAWASLGPVAVGTVLSVLAPRRWVQASLKARLAAQDPHPWPAPDFAAARAAADVDAVDVVVVGAGIGGLTAAALLAQSGLKVLVAEQHTAPGGYAHTWGWTGRDGAATLPFRFDSGVHDVSGVWPGGPVHGVLARLGLGEAIAWQRLQHRFVTDGKAFDVPTEWDAYVDAMAARLPDEAAALRAALADIRTLFEGMYAEAPRRSGIPGSPRSVQGLLDYARAHPLVVRWLDQPFARLLQAHGLSPQAQAMLLGLAGYVTDDAATLTVGDMVPLFGYTLKGGWYPQGGSGVLAQALADAIALDGGIVRLGTPVQRVQVEGGRVQGVVLAGGETVRAAAVVLNADLLGAARGLIAPDAWPAATRAALAQRAPACSAFCVHLGVRGGFGDLPALIHLRRGGQGVGIVLPTQADASAAPAGYSTVELIRLLPQDEARTWFAEATETATDDPAMRHSAAYAGRKRRLADELIDLAETALPGLRARIVCRTEASPLTFRRYNWSTQGAIYGSTGPKLPVKTPIEGLVLAGSATHGPGIEAVVISGALAADALVPGLLDSVPAQAITNS